MSLKRYRILAIEPALRKVMIELRGSPAIEIVAHTMDSAWRKFVTQRFGALKPDPAHYDISLVRDEPPYWMEETA